MVLLWMIIALSASYTTKRTAYLSMLRSIIKYGSAVWVTVYKHGLEEIEKVQSKATKCILINNAHYLIVT